MESDEVVRVALAAWVENGPTPAAFEAMAPHVRVAARKRMQAVLAAVEPMIRADEQVRLAWAVARTVSSNEAEIRADQDRKTREQITADIEKMKHARPKSADWFEGYDRARVDASWIAAEGR